MEQVITLSAIGRDTLKGLTSAPKYLLPRYFYDDRGSKIFQDIMNMPEYYLTDCEFEIFNRYKSEILKAISGLEGYFDLVELGSGDGVKTEILLKHFTQEGAKFKYVPIDISLHANQVLCHRLNKTLPELMIDEQMGDYFHILENLQKTNHHPKTILFLGANIGNLTYEETKNFLRKVALYCNKGDKFLIGIDLKKSPRVIMNAYDDAHGHTKRFNFNHLSRLNNELDADFDLDSFEHQTSYSPITGSVKSFMVSKKKQVVHLKALNEKVYFEQWEPIFMELSQKYNIEDIELLAQKSGFKVIRNFMDRKTYFVDSLWERI